MNKTQLVEALAAKIGDRRTAASAVDGVLEIITETVGGGDSVTLTGFGVFEARARAARVARNPRTGETVPVPATTVPAFRPGTAFKTTVSEGATGSAKRPPVRRSTRSTGTAATRSTTARPAARTAARAAGSFSEEKPAPVKKAPAKKPAAAKATATKTTAAKSTAAKAPAKATEAKATETKVAATKATAKKPAAKKTAEKTAKKPAKKK